MQELLTQAQQLFGQAGDLLKNPLVAETARKLFSWVKGAFTKPSEQKRMEQLEAGEADEKMIDKITSNLEDALEDDESLVAELKEQLQAVQEMMKEAGMTINKTNTMNITGDGNIGLQDLSGSNVNININK